ncbi:MAG: PIN domain-containing protein [Deltaproteobacteria bacterium]|nr:PIN domain-containing protein [Deltaproteobacteria bacterium]
MTVRTFVDTNILVYAEDADAGHKFSRANERVRELWQSGDGVVSIQVLQELFVTLTRKLGKPMTHREAKTVVEEYLAWRVVENNGALLVDAMRLASAAKLSFWDAMVVQAALSAGCELLLSEDLQHGRRFGKLRVENPFVG